MEYAGNLGPHSAHTGSSQSLLAVNVIVAELKADGYGVRVVP
jgi:hypothetical protein